MKTEDLLNEVEVDIREQATAELAWKDACKVIRRILRAKEVGDGNTGRKSKAQGTGVPESS